MDQLEATQQQVVGRQVVGLQVVRLQVVELLEVMEYKEEGQQVFTHKVGEEVKCKEVEEVKYKVSQ